MPVKSLINGKDGSSRELEVPSLREKGTKVTTQSRGTLQYRPNKIRPENRQCLKSQSMLDQKR